MAKASNAFTAAMKKKTRVFNKSRKAKPGQFTIPEIKDGSYVARITLTCRAVGDENKPVASFKWTIARGKEKGVSHSKDIWLTDKDKEREQKNFDEMSKCLQVLGYDMDDVETDQFLEIAEEVTKDKPLVKIALVNKTAKNGSGKKYLNCHLNELLDEDDEEEEKASSGKAKKKSKAKEKDEEEDDEEEEEEDDDDTDEDEEDEDSDDDDSEEDDSDEDEDEDEDEEVELIEKGDSVKYKRKVCDVTSSNKRKEICALRHEKSGTVYKNVSWDDVVVQ